MKLIVRHLFRFTCWWSCLFLHSQYYSSSYKRGKYYYFTLYNVFLFLLFGQGKFIRWCHLLVWLISNKYWCSQDAYIVLSTCMIGKCMCCTRIDVVSVHPGLGIRVQWLEELLQLLFIAYLCCMTLCDTFVNVNCRSHDSLWSVVLM